MAAVPQLTSSSEMESQKSEGRRANFSSLEKRKLNNQGRNKKNNERIQPLYLRQNYSLLKQTIDILIKGLMNRKWNGLLKVIKVIKVIYKEQRPHV